MNTYYILPLEGDLEPIGPMEWKEAVYREAIIRMEGGKCAILVKTSGIFDLPTSFTTIYQMVVDWDGRAIE